MNSLARWETYSPVQFGLEDMFKRLDAFHDSSASNYPPYNIIKIDDVIKHDNINYEVYVQNNEKIHKYETYRKPVLMPSDYVFS